MHQLERCLVAGGKIVHGMSITGASGCKALTTAAAEFTLALDAQQAGGQTPKAYPSHRRH